MLESGGVLSVVDVSMPDNDPLGEILATTDRVANHDLTARARVDGPEEFRRIAGGVNELAAALKGFQDHLAEENEHILSEM